MSRSKKQQTELIRVTGQLEQELQRLGAQGRGLTEKTQSVAVHLTRDLMQNLERVAQARNKLIHGEGVTESELTEVRNLAEGSLKELRNLEITASTSPPVNWRKHLPILQGEALIVWFAMFALLYHLLGYGTTALMDYLATLEWQAPGNLEFVLHGLASLLVGYLSATIARNLLIAVEDGLAARVALHQAAAIAAALLLVPFVLFTTQGALEWYRNVTPFAVAGSLVWLIPAWLQLRRIKAQAN